jgi:hypothetical protein
MPASQNSKNYPNGCVFAMNTAFQNWLAGQPGWAKWLEGIAAAIAVIGISLVTFGLPEEVGGELLVDAETDELVDGPIEADANAAGWEGGWNDGEWEGRVREWEGEGQGWMGGDYGVRTVALENILLL